MSIHSEMPLGFHVSKNGRDMATALREDMAMLARWGFNPCAQIFVSGPQSFKETLTPADKRAIAAATARGLALVIHGAYVDHPWSLRAQGSIHNVRQELRIAAEIGATGVIVHLSAGAADDETLAHVLNAIAAGNDGAGPSVPPPTLWLEIHTAKASAATYETPQKIRHLFERIAYIKANSGIHLPIGLCIDTAHLFSCGKSLDTSAAAQEWIDGLPDNVPFMLHLNDSASKLGSGIDRHASLTTGGIWGAYAPGGLPIEDSGLNTILTWAERKGIMVILERGGEVESDLALLRQLGHFANE